MLHIYFTLAVLGCVCLCCCSVCCCWLCILKPNSNKVKCNQTAAVPTSDEGHDDEAKKMKVDVVKAQTWNDYERWTDDGKTDVESARTDRKLLNKQGLNHNMRTSILNKITSITNSAK